ncbi:DUF937 domain-containing protein [bacterium]|nr:DUF937 domain-containing protein [bacterium]
MSSLLDGLTERLGSDDFVEKLSGILGADKAQTSAAVQKAIPALVAGLARNAQTPQGAQALHNALANDHDGSALDAGPQALETNQEQGDKILGHVFGPNTGAVQAQLAANTGMGAANAGSLLQMLAPMVMGYLGQQQRGGGLDAGGLASVLGGSGAAGMLPGGLGALLGGGGGGGLMSAIGKIFGRR